jgi:molybdate transport system substrate-binding protein
MTTYRPVTMAAAAVLALVASLASAQAAEVRLTSTIGVKALVETLAPGYERASGNKLVITWGVANVLKGKLEAGAPFDVAILTGEVVDALVKDGKIATASRVEIARSGVGVGVRQGEVEPDIASVDAFKRALLAAKSVCYSKKGASGLYAASLMDRLGIAAAMRPKTLLAEGGVRAEDFLLDGRCALSIQQVSEIVPVKGVALVGSVPAELQTITAFAAGIAAGARPAAATAADGFIKFLTSPAAAKIITANGMKPG